MIWAHFLFTFFFINWNWIMKKKNKNVSSYRLDCFPVIVDRIFFFLYLPVNNWWQERLSFLKMSFLSVHQQFLFFLIVDGRLERKLSFCKRKRSCGSVIEESVFPPQDELKWKDKGRAHRREHKSFLLIHDLTHEPDSFPAVNKRKKKKTFVNDSWSNLTLTSSFSLLLITAVKESLSFLLKVCWH